MRQKYLAAEEQQTLQQQLQQIKEETQRQERIILNSCACTSWSLSLSLSCRLRSQTLSKTPVPTTPRATPRATPTRQVPSLSSPRPLSIDANIARWIEERNILLQTGVYTHADPTIQKLDKKIQEALLEKRSSYNSSS